MKAVICTRYGPPEVLRLAQVPKPIPKRNEVCIRVRSSAATASDQYIRASQISLPYLIPMRLALGVTKPRRLVIGLVLAGDVESVGEDITRFRPGDRVYGLAGFHMGAYAEYVCLGEADSMSSGCLAIKPETITYEEATAAAYGGLLAMQSLREGSIQKGQKVLIYGASGTSGTIAVQLAKHYGAEVTAVCGAAHVEMVRSLGADDVLDYTDADSVGRLQRYDFMLDAAGKRKSSPLKIAAREALLPQGTFASIDDKLEMSSEALHALRELIDAGHVKPVLDRVYPLEQIVQAHVYVQQGHKSGGVAITIGS